MSNRLDALSASATPCDHECEGSFPARSGATCAQTTGERQCNVRAENEASPREVSRPRAGSRSLTSIRYAYVSLGSTFGVTGGSAGVTGLPPLVLPISRLSLPIGGTTIFGLRSWAY